MTTETEALARIAAAADKADAVARGRGRVTPQWVRDVRAVLAEVQPTPPDEDADATIVRLGELLDGVARALRGDPPPLTSWSYHDLPERAAEMRRRAERVQR